MGVATIAVQVLHRVNLHECGYERNDEENDDRKSVDGLSNGECVSPTLPPRPGVNDGFDKGVLATAVHTLDPLVCGADGYRKTCHH